MQAYDKSNGAAPTLGGHELGTTATEPSFVEDIHVLFALLQRFYARVGKLSQQALGYLFC